MSRYGNRPDTATCRLNEFYILTSKIVFNLSLDRSVHGTLFGDSPSKFTLLTKSYTRLDFDSHAMTIYGIIPCNVNVMRANLKGESRAHHQAIQLRPVLACFR